MLDLSVVIVSFNTRDMTLRCLRALFDDLERSPLKHEVIVVDNDSRDGSADAVAQEFPVVKLIRNPTNAGFGAANNLAMRQSTGRLVLLLNSDAFVHAGACPSMVERLNDPAWAKVGVLAPRLLNEDGTLQRSVYPFPSPLRCWVENLWLSKALADHPTIGDFRRWPHDCERDVPWAIGACLLIRREAIDVSGLFDERFFMYAEETDWLKRIRDAGWAVRFTPEAVVTHFGGGSGREERARINRHFFQSLDRYELKHHGVFGLLLMRLAMVIGCVLRGIGWAGVWLLMPRRRDVASSKVKLMSWLTWRQLTHWRGLA